MRGFPSPGTLQDLDRWTEDSFWLDLLSVASPSSAERFRERSLAWETQTKDGQAARLRRPGLYQEDTVPRTRPEPPPQTGSQRSASHRADPLTLEHQKDIGGTKFSKLG